MGVGPVYSIALGPDAIADYSGDADADLCTYGVAAAGHGLEGARPVVPQARV